MQPRPLAFLSILAACASTAPPPAPASIVSVAPAAPATPPAAPVVLAPPPPPRATALAAGTYATCARFDDGSARCWGTLFYLSYGESIPDPRQANSNTAVKVTGLDAIDALGLGTYYACAISRGEVWCWGANGTAHGEGGNRYAPARVAGLSHAKALATAPDHACALLVDGTAACWGSNFYGALGAGSVGRMDRYAPVAVKGLAGAVALASGHTHTCAALADGTARCWGSNKRGQLGDGTRVDRPAPTPVRGLDEIVELSLGDASEVPVEARLASEHTCARRRDGSVWCWGDDRFGQLGDGRRVDRPTPAQVEGVVGATTIAAGSGFTCALAGGEVLCWGDNRHGQLGDGTMTRRDRPAKIAGLGGATAIAARGFHGCALLGDGSVRCWGDNIHGEMGDGTGAFSRGTPVRVVGFE